MMTDAEMRRVAPRSMYDKLEYGFFEKRDHPAMPKRTCPGCGVSKVLLVARAYGPRLIARCRACIKEERAELAPGYLVTGRDRLGGVELGRRTTFERFLEGLRWTRDFKLEAFQP